MLCGPFIRWHHAVNLRWQGQCPKNIGRLPKEQAFSARHYCARSKHTNARPEGPLKPQVRLERINSRLPKFLREYTKPLINAPLSHVSAFLLLHELTAIIPLLTLAGAFHYTQWTPSLIGEWQWAAEGVEKFGGYFRRKGWLQKENDKVEEGRKSSSNSQSRTKIVLEYVSRVFRL